jgi:chromosome segregation ATPase
MTRLKGLLETYKTSKDEAEERCSQLELECDKLKKKLQHYKEEDQFNKSYLSRLKTSKIQSQNESVVSLQEDNEELVSEIDELQR